MRRKIAIKAAFISALAFALSMVIMQPFGASVSALFSSPEKNDFTLSDFYIMTADGRAVAHLDDNIVIINIDRSDRADIARTLDMLGLCGPAAVGLDVIFADEREGDENLLAALDRTPALIQPLTLVPENHSTDTFRISEASYYFDPKHTEGFASTALPSKFSNSMIREFRPTFKTVTAGDIDGFAPALARLVHPETMETLQRRNHKLETINYHSRRFRIYEPEDIMDHASDINGRIVLIGAMTEPGDLHPTPVNSLMPGVMIHAHALATILDGAYLSVTPKWIHLLLAFALCYFIVYLALRNTTKTKGLMLRLIQVACVLALVQTGYWLFVRHNVVFDTSNALLMVLFGLFAADIWFGMEGLIERGRESKIADRLRQKIKK